MTLRPHISTPGGLLVALALLLVMGACDRRTVVNRYRSISAEGWEQYDTLVFTVDSIKEKGLYAFDIGLRITNDFPYQAIYLLIEQKWDKPRTWRSDTLRCPLASPDGDITGSGISQLQYTIPFTTLDLTVGQRGQIIVRHLMRRDLLPGVTSIGVELKKERPS